MPVLLELEQHGFPEIVMQDEDGRPTNSGERRLSVKDVVVMAMIAPAMAANAKW